MPMIRRIDPDTTMSRATVHNGVIYFCGHVAPGADMTEQATKLLTRYEELLLENGSDKDHILFATIYVTEWRSKANSTPCGTSGFTPAALLRACAWRRGWAEAAFWWRSP